MGKTLAYNFVKGEIEKEGYKLLSSKYYDSKYKLLVECPAGHYFEVSRSKWIKGKRCCYCSGVLVHPPSVRQAFEKEGYTLLDDYERGKCSTKKLRFICPNGHHQSIRWNGWSIGQRCFECTQSIITIEKVKKAIEKVGFELISKKYKGANHCLKIRCNKGHDFEMRWRNFNSGQRCSKCRKNAPLNYYDVKKRIEKENYILLSKIYKNGTSPLCIECPQGHRYIAKWRSFQAGHRCRLCNNNSGFNCDMPGWIYYLKINIESRFFYKIGVTNKSLKKRIRNIPYPCEILWQEPYLLGLFAYEKEQEILSEFQKYRNKEHFNFAGYTEMFTKDVLGKDLKITPS